MTITNALSGYKTYIVAAATAVGALAAIATGTLSPTQGLLTIGLALAQIFLRAGSKDDAARAAVLTGATLVEQLAPAVARLMPSSAAAVATIEKVATDVVAALAPVPVVAVPVVVAPPAPSAVPVDPAPGDSLTI